jgi:hypothetical protein
MSSRGFEAARVLAGTTRPQPQQATSAVFFVLLLAAGCGLVVLLYSTLHNNVN